jgi:outer membrane protein assembly factor BamB
MLGRQLEWIAVSLGIGALWMACNSNGGSEIGGDAGPSGGTSVLEQHLHPTRDGAYIDPKMTKTAAANAHMINGFPATITGIAYGDPLFVAGWKKGQDAIFVATNANHVTAFDASNGTQLWDVTLGTPVNLANLPCKRNSPVYGIMETPVIDLPSRSLYVETFQTLDGNTQKHLVYALSIDDGTTKPGWPVDVAAKLTGFNSTDQNDRGGMTLLNGTLYIPYASVNADCGTYHGWVVGINTSDPTKVDSYTTPGERAGIWGTLSNDGTSVFAVTGNTARGTTTWSGGEALLRFSPGPKFSGAKTDYFTPSNWQYLDEHDYDLGSCGSVLFDMPMGVTPQHLAVAMGKYGVVHLLDRDNLGGVGTGDGFTGEGIFSLSVAHVGFALTGIAASYASAKGRYFVLRTETAISVCPNGTSGDLLALTVTATSPPKLVPAWCAVSQGRGSPVATTTDGTSNALVWITSSDGTNRLLAFDGDTGAPVFTGGGMSEQMGDIYQWTSPIDDGNGKLFVGGSGALYAFTTQ